jgi:hypothetical protein
VFHRSLQVFTVLQVVLLAAVACLTWWFKSTGDEEMETVDESWKLRQLERPADPERVFTAELLKKYDGRPYQRWITLTLSILRERPDQSDLPRGARAGVRRDEGRVL